MLTKRIVGQELMADWSVFRRNEALFTLTGGVHFHSLRVVYSLITCYRQHDICFNNHLLYNYWENSFVYSGLEVWLMKVYIYFEKGCRWKVNATIPKGIVGIFIFVVFGLQYFGQIWEHGTRCHVATCTQGKPTVTTLPKSDPGNCEMSNETFGTKFPTHLTATGTKTST